MSIYEENARKKQEMMLGIHPEKVIPKPMSSACLSKLSSLLNFLNVQDKIQPTKLDATCLEGIGRLNLSELFLPYFTSRVAAGYPSPADDAIDTSLDLNQHLIHRPTDTYYVTATGDSMIEAGIFHKDILVVDRSLEAKHGSIVIAAVNGELTVKRLYKEGTHVMLKPENAAYPAITITEDMSFFIEGVVTSVIHQLSNIN